MSTQHLNLLDARLLPQRVPFSSTQAVAAMGFVLLATVGVSAALDVVAGPQRAAKPPPLPALMTMPVAALAAEAETELQQLQHLDAAQARVLEALNGHTANAPSAGYSAVFNALARQAGSALWITSFAVGKDGDTIDLEGRMIESAALPDYLRRLNRERPFVGRPFEQLQLQSVDAVEEGAPRITAFTLRAHAPAAPTVAPEGAVAAGMAAQAPLPTAPTAQVAPPGTNTVGASTTGLEGGTVARAPSSAPAPRP